VLNVSYTDKAVGSIPALSASGSVVLRAPVLGAEQATDTHQASKVARDGRNFIDQIRNNSYIVFGRIDLTSVKTAMPVISRFGDLAGGEIELHIDAVDGPVIGTTDFKNARATKIGEKIEVLTGKLAVKPTTGKHDLYVVFKNANAGDKKLFYFSRLELSNK